jgi:hypothetical protein
MGVHSTNNLNDNYIGSGIKFMNYVKKYKKENFYREIIKFFDARDDAFIYEKQLLTEVVLSDELCLNLVVGGIGYAHEYNETFKDRISKTRISKLQDGSIKPTKHTEAHKQRLREHNPGGVATSKPIYQIDSMSGAVIKEWKSSRAAGIELGISGWGNISKVANKLKTQTIGGCFWRWVGDKDVVNNVLTTVDGINTKRLDNSTRSGKQIIQMDDNKNIINIWKNASIACRALGITNSAVSRAIKTSKKHAGFYWRF